MEVSALKDFDLYLYHQGTNFYAYQMLGAHFVVEDGVEGVRFAVWAPHAKAISVVGDFNNWDYNENPMQRIFSYLTLLRFSFSIFPAFLYFFSPHITSLPGIILASA